MPVFKIDAKLLTLQAEQIAVILGRLKMGGGGERSATGDTGCKFKACAGSRGAAGGNRGGPGCKTDCKVRGGSTGVGMVLAEVVVIKRGWKRPGRLFGSLFGKGARWWFVSVEARVVAG